MQTKLPSQAQTTVVNLLGRTGSPWSGQNFLLSFYFMHSFKVLTGSAPVCVKHMRSEVVLSFLQTTSSWLGPGQTAWRTWWSWMGRSSALRCGTSHAPVCWRSSKTPALKRECWSSILKFSWSVKDGITELMGIHNLVYVKVTLVFMLSHVCGFFFAFQTSLLTWRPAGQDEEAADAKHFVRGNKKPHQVHPVTKRWLCTAAALRMLHTLYF